MIRRERVLAAIRHREVDRVPKGEIDIAARLCCKLLGVSEDRLSNGGITFEEHKSLREQLGMDLVVVEMDVGEHLCTGKDADGRELVRDVWGNVRILSAGKDVYGAGPVEHAITGASGLSEYDFPDIVQFSAKKATLWSERTDFFVFVLIGGVFETIRALTGLENMCLYTYQDSLEVVELAQRVALFHAELAKKAVADGAHAVLVSDDMASNKGTLLSPEMLRELFFPALKMQVMKIREEGVPVFLHCDGNIKKILQDIVNCGFDGLHALQPSAGMSLAEVKCDYGDSLCLMGNIDLDDVLPFGSPEEVRVAVKEAVDSAACGGGYILSTCNVLTQDIPVANVLAMYEAAEEYGHYPMNPVRS